MNLFLGAAAPESLKLVEGGGFEPPKLSRQIYSLIPLAAREPLQKGRVLSTRYHLKSTPTQPDHCKEIGAGERSRTPDRLITSQLLYQLSYASIISAIF